MTEKDDHRPLLARRELIAGAGLLAGVAASAAASTPAAAAAGSAADGPVSEASPIITTIASPRLPGFVYRHAFMFDFSAEGSASNRAWGGSGVYTANATSLLWASVEIPAGALIRDIEWYVRNNSGATVTAINRLWAAGTGTLGTGLGDTAIPAGPSIAAVRTVTTSTVWGPHPTGTKLALGLRTPTDASVQINGVRVGFSHGAGEVASLMTPVKAYDTRDGDGKFGKGETRQIALPASAGPAGITGVFVNVSALDGQPKGRLKIWPNGFAEPGAVTLYYDDRPTGAYVFVPTPPTRLLNVKATRPTHVSINVVSWVG